MLQAETSLRLNAFAGSTLRGGFGHLFKRTVCTWPPGDCQRCLLKNTCSYPYIFETGPPPGSEKLRAIDQIPRPYVIEPPESTPSPHQGEGRGEGRMAGRNGASSSIPHPSSLSYRPGEHFDFHLVLIGRAIDYLPYFLFTFIELGRVASVPTVVATPWPKSTPNPLLPSPFQGEGSGLLSPGAPGVRGVMG